MCNRTQFSLCFSSATWSGARQAVSFFLKRRQHEWLTDVELYAELHVREQLQRVYAQMRLQSIAMLRTMSQLGARSRRLRSALASRRHAGHGLASFGCSWVACRMLASTGLRSTLMSNVAWQLGHEALFDESWSPPKACWLHS